MPAAQVPKRRKAPVGKKIPGLDQVKEGMILNDVLKNRWRVGRLLGTGGFGIVYETVCIDENPKNIIKLENEYAIKIEPGDSGGLFTEIAFYKRVCKYSSIQDYLKSKKLKILSLPYFISSGLHEMNKKNLRFLILPKYGTDLENVWIHLKKSFDVETIARIAVKLIEVLEYIHSFGYVHADLKPTNILTNFLLPQLNGNIFLTDFGLVSLYLQNSINGIHKEYKELKKCKHDGTIELTSCDAHRGAQPSRRGDLEILGYMLLRLYVSELPWEKHKSYPEIVAAEKFKFAEDYTSIISMLIPKNTIAIKKLKQGLDIYFETIFALEYAQQPDYKSLSNIFLSILPKTKSTNALNADIPFK